MSVTLFSTVSAELLHSGGGSSRVPAVRFWAFKAGCHGGKSRSKETIPHVREVLYFIVYPRVCGTLTVLLICYVVTPPGPRPAAIALQGTGLLLKNRYLAEAR